MSSKLWVWVLAPVLAVLFIFVVAYNSDRRAKEIGDRPSEETEAEEFASSRKNEVQPTPPIAENSTSQSATSIQVDIESPFSDLGNMGLGPYTIKDISGHYARYKELAGNGDARAMLELSRVHRNCAMYESTETSQPLFDKGVLSADQLEMAIGIANDCLLFTPEHAEKEALYLKQSANAGYLAAQLEILLREPKRDQTKIARFLDKRTIAHDDYNILLQISNFIARNSSSDSIESHK